MKQKQFIDLPNSSTCFGQFFAHPQERKTVIYSMQYNAFKDGHITGKGAGSLRLCVIQSKLGQYNSLVGK
jgi:hypothetical protein